MFLRRKCLILLTVLFFVAGIAASDTATLLVLHTNDIHDYVKPGPNSIGGLPYLAGYVAAKRVERGDILLLDGGDVMEKGDMVSFKTQSRVAYQIMRKMGYAAGAVGNHDLTHGTDHLKECAELAGMAIVCANHFDSNGELAFSPSTVVEVNGIRVGVIGMTNIRGSIKEDGKRLADEAKKLEADTHLLVVVAHIGSRECVELSRMVPQISLFISAHTHEALQTPVVVPETNALIVQAGQYARYIGHLELVVDRQQKRIVNHDGKLVQMSHGDISPDAEALAWVEAQEQQYCPEAAEVVGTSTRFVSDGEMALFAAAALRDYSKADVAFCHPGRVMRSGLFPGDVCVNALFRTGGQRGRDLVAFQMTGAQIGAYIAGLLEERRGRTEWSGFAATVAMNSDTKSWAANTSLEADKTYRVIMPEQEWSQRFLRVAKDSPVFQGFDEKASEPAGFTFTEALAAYAKQVTGAGKTIDAHVAALSAEKNL